MWYLVHWGCSRTTPVLKVPDTHTPYSAFSSCRFKFLSSLQSIPAAALLPLKCESNSYLISPSPHALCLATFSLYFFFSSHVYSSAPNGAKMFERVTICKRPTKSTSFLYLVHSLQTILRFFLTIHPTMFPQHTWVKWMKPLVLYSWVATLLSGTVDTCFCFCLLNAKRGKLYFSSGRISIRKSPHTWELIITWKTWLKCNH